MRAIFLPLFVTLCLSVPSVVLAEQPQTRPVPTRAAVQPTPRIPEVRGPSAPRSTTPRSTVPAPRGSAAKRTAPETRKKADASKVKGLSFSLPLFQKLQPDADVSTGQLANGLVHWCRQHPAWKVSHLSLAIVAGSSQDPAKKEGRSRFLARLLEQQLNRAANPARPPFPKGRTQYRVSLRKDWMIIEAKLASEHVAAALAHLAATLSKDPTLAFNDRELNKIRKELRRSAGRFPRASVSEQVDLFLFPKHTRAALLRGKRRSFRRLSRAVLEKGYKALFEAGRMRLLVVGQQDCNNVSQEVNRHFGPLKGKPESLATLFRIPSDTSRRGRLLFTQALIYVYALPALTSEDVLPLQFVHHVAMMELKRATRERFGRTPPIRTQLQDYHKRGYLLFGMPNPSSRRRPLRELVRKALGRFLMDPYEPPELEARLRLYQQQAGFALQERAFSPSGYHDQLLAQLLLPSVTKKPISATSVSAIMTPENFRLVARRYLNKTEKLERMPQAFSFQRIGFFIATLLLVWFTFDLFLRRGRRFE